MTDWTIETREGLPEALERARTYLTPWRGALDALGALQSKRVGAPLPPEMDEWRNALTESGVATRVGRLTALGAILADREAERRFRDLFDI